jgi:PAP2 superfamily
MRAHTQGKHEIGKRFAILIGRGIKHRTLLVLSLAAMVGALAVPVAQAQGAGAATTESADVVVDWNNNAQTAIIGTANQGPTVAYLHLAMVQGAVYDAVNAIEGGYEPYLGVPATADPDPGDSAPAAVATAAHDVLVALFPGQKLTLDAKLGTSLAAIPNGDAKTGGMEVGAAAAAAMYEARCVSPSETPACTANDGRFSPFTVTQGDEPGEWRSTAFTSTGTPVVEPAPWVGNVKPFLIPSAAALRTDGPNALTSAAYAADFNEVKRLGSLTSTVRTPDQTDAALFWQANGAGLFNAIFRQLAVTQKLDIAEAARMFAMTNMAGADGAIGCWKDKYYWKFWRPITAIRQADNDGNPSTLADQNWTPLFTTPPFPEHPSGHTCISGAVVETLQDFFGTDKIAFGTFSGFSNSSRSFERFSDAIKEIIDARVWAGIHFRTADVQGAVLGKKVARYLREHYFQPTG